MRDVVILGTDTDAGKTTLALLWLAADPDQFTYWKPLETGDSDSARVRSLVPDASVFSSHLSLKEPTAPMVAAAREGVAIPSAAQLVQCCPASRRSNLIETFGGAFSPLNDNELQIEFVRRLNAACVLVGPSSVGAVGRMHQAVRALRADGVSPAAIVLLGVPDSFAEEQVSRLGVPVTSLEPPSEWTPAGVAESARRQSLQLGRLTKAVRRPCESMDWNSRDRAVVWHPYTSLREPDDPLCVVGASDEFLHLADGQTLIDAISSWWTILFRHRDPILIQALHRAAASIDHVLFAGVTHPWAVDLAELLLASSPWTGGKVFYSDNGSTAVEAALKLAYQSWVILGQPQRTTFVGFEHGYHGDTFGAMAVGRDPLFFGAFEPLLFQTAILPLDPNRRDEFLSTQAATVAGVIVEPLVEGAGGMRMHTPETLRDLFQVCRRHGVLFIADEVMTGGGRTGLLWAHQAAEIAPDLICTAKTLAGGMMPLAATLVSPRVVLLFDGDDRSQMFFHGHSFTAHPLACAVAVANWRRFANSPPPEAKQMEQRWTELFEPLQDHRRVAEIRIRGSIAAVEWKGDSGYLAVSGRRMKQESIRRGVLLRPLGNVTYAMPPLGASDETLSRIAEVIRAFAEHA